MLQQYWAPSSRPISGQQALVLGFFWHRGPEKRCTRSDAGAEVPLLMRCIYSGKVLLPSPPALQDSHRGVGENIGRGRGWVVVGRTRVFGKVGSGLWACGVVGWQGVLCVLCVQCPTSRLNVCTGCPTSGLNMCTCWPARGPPAQAVPVCCWPLRGLYGGLYGPCVWPAWGCAEAAPASCGQLQLPVSRCNSELTEPSGALNERSLSHLARSLSARCAIWRAH